MLRPPLDARLSNLCALGRRPDRFTAAVVEDEAAAYTGAALEGLRRAGCVGAMLLCYSDYDPTLRRTAPFDLAPHELSFGLWRADGSPKASAAVVAAFAGAEHCSADYADPWIDIERCDFSRDPGLHLSRLYGRYREAAC